MRADLQSEDPQVVAAISARVARSILEHCGDIIHALVTGAAAEPELAAVLAEGQRRHVAGATTVVTRLRELGAPVGPSAVETLAAVSDVRFALVLQESYGWSLDQLERWMTDTGTTLLLRASPPLGSKLPGLAPSPPLGASCLAWRLARAALGELRRAGARRVGGLVVLLLLRVALGRHGSR